MGFGKLNVWVSEIQQPCKISSRTWWVVVRDCEGQVFNYCGERFGPLEARCGHIELKLPPGTYKVFAIGRPRYRYEGHGIFVRYNIYTDDAIVRINCDQATCVTLYPPSIHRCGWFIIPAVLAAMSFGSIAEDKGKRLLGALTDVLNDKELGQPVQADETPEFVVGLLRKIADEDEEAAEDFAKLADLFAEHTQGGKKGKKD